MDGYYTPQDTAGVQQDSPMDYGNLNVGSTYGSAAMQKSFSHDSGYASVYQDEYPFTSPTLYEDLSQNYATSTYFSSFSSYQQTEQYEDPSVQSMSLIQYFNHTIGHIEVAARNAIQDAKPFCTSYTWAPEFITWSEVQEMKETLASQGHEWEANRGATQQVLYAHLRGHFEGGCATSDVVSTMLQEAAVQIYHRIPFQGEDEVADNLCYLAIVAVLQRLRDAYKKGSGSAKSPRSTNQSSSEKEKFPCEECDKVFGRSADLDRHIENVHFDEEKKSKFYCDYKKCSRHKSPFFRRDHFRDHLRDYHKEDLPRRGLKIDDAWWATRSPNAIFNGWWRCNRCLVKRVDHTTYGYTCPGCGNHCEQERQKYRSRVLSQ